MILGVPTLNRYDLLGRLIASAESGRLKPNTYLIVDNGGQFDAEARKMPGVAAALARDARIIVLTPGKNLGVAASWNAILDWATPLPVTISNDDIELGEDTLATLDLAIAAHDFVIAEGGWNANGWCLFAQAARCAELIGPYDENFYPAYYEDLDYERRLKLAGITPFRAPTIFHHEGWATMRADASHEISSGQGRSNVFFQKKWGGAPSKATFSEPFNGGAGPGLRNNPPQTGWRKYGPETTTMRWDIINHAARFVGARTYLEIGVCDGASMRNVIGIARSLEKWGVDPAPHHAGIVACDAFSHCGSDEFFSTRRRRKFDVAFVDGLHHADQAYRDIINAARTARVVLAHDSNPSTEGMQRVPAIQSEWTGDVWKAIARIRAEGQHMVRTVDTDYGVAVVIPNRRESVRQLPRESWEDLVQNRAELLGLISVSEWKNWFEGAIR